MPIIPGTVIRTFQVFPDVPQALQPLVELAHNFWWVWQPDAAELFRRLDRDLWTTVYHNPVKLLGSISQERLIDAASDGGYLAHLARVYAQFRQHMDEPGWYKTNYPKDDALHVAYFSAEFGLHESLPVYSGGLGILAGDHLKSAAEIGLPLVGVGLMYRNGYFEQYLSADGWQQERYPELDFYQLAIELQKNPDGTELRIKLELPDSVVIARVWKVQVGRVPLYLMDTNLPDNSPGDRDITARLYGGGSEMRIRQEIVLGIGGVRALAILRPNTSIYHMNEGHAAFLALERVRTQLITAPAMTFDEARQHVMSTNIFTTHTPVPAGIDMFPPELVSRYFQHYWPGLKLNEEGFLALGREDVTNRKQGFSMAVLALRLADSYNGVSKLHGDVSREMWHNLWPGVPIPEVPITSVTNGIHTRTWLSPEIVYILDRYLGDAWQSNPADQSIWQNVSQIPDEELWRAHERCREKFVVWARQTTRYQLQRRGATFDAVAAADTVLDPEALTIGFARRFATYKRGALVLRDIERLKKLLDDAKKPIQFVFAGKAHPADHEGKELIKSIVNFARDPALRRKFVFIENYDMNVARYLVQGVDVWLNTPRRPYEASGTSGMKAAANGVLNCSVLDGWWVEGYALDPATGWAIGHGENYADVNYQDQIESEALYDILEKQIIPTFYDRAADGVPHEWVRRMKACMTTLAPVFNTNRMVREYAERLYLPAMRRGMLLGADAQKRGIALAHDKDRLRGKWSGIKMLGVHTSGNGHYRVGDLLQVEALIELPGIEPKELSVELYAGVLNSGGDAIESPRVIPMPHAREVAPGRHLFTGRVPCESSGRQGLAVRVMPGLKDMATPFEPGLIMWG
jgi:glycogen phosphorylase